MSISTLESRTSVRMLDAKYSESDAREEAERGAREDIARSFALLRTMPAKLITVPSVGLTPFGDIREKSLSMQEAISEMVTDGYAFQKLLSVLQSSDCPLVQEYRDALCQEYQRMNADDVAGARV